MSSLRSRSVLRVAACFFDPISPLGGACRHPPYGPPEGGRGWPAAERPMRYFGPMKPSRISIQITSYDGAFFSFAMKLQEWNHSGWRSERVIARWSADGTSLQRALWDAAELALLGQQAEGGGPEAVAAAIQGALPGRWQSATDDE